ncbi:hypothetical protein ACLK19_08205 [Escherichia coli]
MRPLVEKICRKTGAGQASSFPGGVLKSAMQRLEQGDVVTETRACPA